MTVCLDSWAVLAWLDGDEPALSRVDAVLVDRPIISWVNLVEVYYRVERDHGRAAADETLADLRAALTADLPGTARMIEAARLKACAAIALGDCFAVATAAARGLLRLTGDPEIIDLPSRPCDVEDLRPPRT
jgi:PIN domain nuclease of toxin-antitoxin system